MSINLPRLPYGSGIRKYETVDFRGLNHNVGAQSGEIYDMKNLCGDSYPVLTPRPGRKILRTLTKPNGICGSDGLYWVDGTSLYKDGTLVGTVADSKKQFADLPYYLVIWPDKVMVNKNTGALEQMEKRWPASGTAAVTIKDGTYAGKDAKANTIEASGVKWEDYFQVGDGVTIQGCTVHPENNKTVVIQEIEGNQLRFLENTFTLGGASESESISIAIEIPDMDYICGHENKLWGCKGDMIYASVGGRPWDFNVFEGTDDDAYFTPAGSAGDFTACFSYRGFPVFCKENNIYKIYGDRVSNYQSMGAATLGVLPGSWQSPANAVETMFFLTRSGVVAYSGGIPQPISHALGPEKYRNGVAGADGRRYFISMQDRTDQWKLFVYDTQTRLWHIEDSTQAVGFAYYGGGLYCLTADGTLWMDGRALETPEGATAEAEVESVCEFADLTEFSPNKKGTAKFQVRVELEAGATMSISAMWDSSGTWLPVRTLTTTVKRSYYLPIVPRRADHFRLKIEGKGMWRLYSLVRESYVGSPMRST